MIRSFENLTTGLTRMRHKAALMLMSNVAEQGALKIEYASAHGTLEFGTLWGLAHGVHGVCVSQPFEPVSRRGVSVRGGAGGLCRIARGSDVDAAGACLGRLFRNWGDESNRL